MTNLARFLFIVGTTSVLTLGACAIADDAADSISGPGGVPDDGSSAPPAGPEDATGSSTAASSNDGSGQEGASPTGQPIATQQVSLAGGGGDVGNVRLDVLSLTRQAGDTVRLEMTITNESDVDFYTGMGASEASLVDLTGNKRYLVILDSEGDCICSETIDVTAHSMVSVYAVFPAPPPETTEVDVTLRVYGAIPAVPVAG